MATVPYIFGYSNVFANSRNHVMKKKNKINKKPINPNNLTADLRMKCCRCGDVEIYRDVEKGKIKPKKIFEKVYCCMLCYEEIKKISEDKKNALNKINEKINCIKCENEKIKQKTEKYMEKLLYQRINRKEVEEIIL